MKEGAKPKSDVKKERKDRKKEINEISKDYTFNLHKRICKIQFKKRAPRAVREIRKFATKEMKTKDVRIDTALNQHLYSHGIRNLPFKIRLRIARKKNEDEDAKEKFYTLVQHVDVKSFAKLGTEVAKK